MNAGKRKLILCVSLFLVFSLNEHFSYCLIEHSDYSIEETMYEMEIFNEYERAYGKCQKMSDMWLSMAEKEWNTQSRIKKHVYDYSFEDYVLPDMTCISMRLYLAQKVRTGQLIPLVSTLILQFLAAKYSLVFARGYLHFSSEGGNMKIAKSCARLAVYLGFFGADTDFISKLQRHFSVRVVTVGNTEQSGQMNLLLFHFKHLAEQVQKEILLRYDSANLSLTEARTDEILSAASYTWIEKYFANLLYGRHQNIPQYSSDRLVWNSVNELTKLMKLRKSYSVSERMKRKSNVNVILREAEFINLKYFLENQHYSYVQDINEYKIGFGNVASTLGLMSVLAENGNSLRLVKKENGRIFIPYHQLTMREIND